MRIQREIGGSDRICAYAQADLWPCWSHIPHCSKYHGTTHYIVVASYEPVQPHFKLRICQ